MSRYSVRRVLSMRRDCATRSKAWSRSSARWMRLRTRCSRSPRICSSVAVSLSDGADAASGESRYSGCEGSSMHVYLSVSVRNVDLNSGAFKVDRFLSSSARRSLSLMLFRVDSPNSKINGCTGFFCLVVGVLSSSVPSVGVGYISNGCQRALPNLPLAVPAVSQGATVELSSFPAMTVSSAIARVKATYVRLSASRVFSLRNSRACCLKGEQESVSCLNTGNDMIGGMTS